MEPLHPDPAHRLPVADPVQRAILFTDVVGSTSLLGREGDERWVELIDHHRRTAAVLSRSCDGAVVGFSGDGFVVAFESAASAVVCALRLQVALWVQAELGVRIGVNSGSVVPFHGNYTGLAVHVASRLTDACDEGEVLIAEHSFDEAREQCALPALERRSVVVRGLPDPVRVRSSRVVVGP